MGWGGGKVAGEVEREAGERRRDRKRRAHTSACGRTHTKQWVKTITEGHYQMRFVKLPGISPPTHPPAVLVPVHFVPLSFLHYSSTLMISLGGSSPHGTVRGTLFCWPLISGFEAGGGATAGEGLRNGLSVGWGGEEGSLSRHPCN